MSRHREQIGKGWFPFVNRFSEMVLHMSEQSPVMVGVTAKPEVERMAMRREGSPDIVASQCLGHAPEFVEDADRAVGLHMTNEMHASRCDRQGGREEVALGGGKPGAVLGALALRRGHALQGRRTVVVHIPLDEARTLTADVAKAAKAMALPKGWATPQPVQLFDLKIVFGFPKGRKISSTPTYKHSRVNCPTTRSTL